jgi:lactate permease
MTQFVWQQNYDPLHSCVLSGLLASVPLALLFFTFLYLKRRVWQSALFGMIAAALLALFVFRMPAALIAISALLGVLFGWMQVAWVIVASIFLFNITAATGQFRLMQESISKSCPDKRIQVVLVAFCFGAFLEGTGSGGTPVAMVGVLLVGLGFPPLQAAKVCLLANTVPLAWGAAGRPIHELASVTGLQPQALNAMTGRILPILSAILPLWLVVALVGRRKAMEVFPALAVCGISFALVQCLWSNFGGPGPVDIMAATVSLAAVLALLRVWRPASIMSSPAVTEPLSMSPAAAPPTNLDGRAPRSTGTMMRGWMTFSLASLFALISGIPAVSRTLSLEILKRPVPLLDNAVWRVPPAVPAPVPERAVADLNIATMHGTAIFLGATIAALLLGLKAGEIRRIFVATAGRLIHALLGVSFMVGFLFVTRYSGMLTTMGLMLTAAGAAYPFVGTFLGWLGVTLSGSSAVSNFLYGHLQRSTAERIGVNPVLMAAANSCGGVMGNMMDPQSILVSSTATQQSGKEAAIFKTVFKHSLLLTSLLGLIVLLYAYVFRGAVPRP